MQNLLWNNQCGTGEWYSQAHVRMWDANDYNFNIEIDIAVSNNPTFIRFSASGTMAKDTLVLAVANGCGGDSLHLVITTPVIPVDTIVQPECCGDTLVYTPQYPSDVHTVYVKSSGSSVGDDSDFRVEAYGYESYAQNHIYYLICNEFNESLYELNITCNVTPPAVTIQWCNENNGINEPIELEVGFVGSCGIDRRIITFQDTCSDDVCGEPRFADKGKRTDQSYNQQVEVYPNPTKGIMTVRFNADAGGLYKMMVYDLTGRVIYIKDIAARKGLNLQEINMNDLAPGTYFLQLKSSTDIKNIKRIIKE